MLYQPYSVVGFHSCDREVGLKVLNGADNLLPSQNIWDWLGEGIYFWEQNPTRAWDYAVQCSLGKQKNAIKIKTPFVLGAMIDLGNCLNLVDANSLQILSEAHKGLSQLADEAGQKMPKNTEYNRQLDCAVIRYIHATNVQQDLPTYDTVRCAFPEGDPVYPDSKITSQLHLQICVSNPDCIKGFFLPRPLKQFNPNL